LVTAFAVVSRARSGGTMVATALERHPEILMHGEIFGPPIFPLTFYGIDGELPWPTPIETVLKKIRDEDPARFLDQFVFAETGRRRVGFRFKFEEFGIWPSVVAYLRDRATPIILVRRRNLVDRLKSAISATTTGSFNTSDQVSMGAYAEELGGPVDGEAIEREIHETEGMYEDFLANFAGSPILDLAYEELVSDWLGQVGRICRFLGITELALEPRTRKRDHENLAGRNEGLGEIIVTLRDTP
jgi:hypothetical protein